jgi:uncharacterized MAPEG superfamily protein
MSSLTTTNYSIYMIPAYYVLAQLPHTIAIGTIRSANNGRWNNANPRSSQWNETLVKSMPAAVFAKYERCEAAHKNMLENMALFTTAVVLGNLASLPAGTLNATVGGYLALRVAYLIAYINTTSRKRSFLRTGIWGASTAVLISLIVRAGNVLAKNK